jgi:hypothetical protein
MVKRQINVKNIRTLNITLWGPSKKGEWEKKLKMESMRKDKGIWDISTFDRSKDTLEYTIQFDPMAFFTK